MKKHASKSKFKHFAAGAALALLVVAAAPAGASYFAQVIGGDPGAGGQVGGQAGGQQQGQMGQQQGQMGQQQGQIGQRSGQQGQTGGRQEGGQTGGRQEGGQTGGQQQGQMGQQQGQMGQQQGQMGQQQGQIGQRSGQQGQTGGRQEGGQGQGQGQGRSRGDTFSGGGEGFEDSALNEGSDSRKALGTKDDFSRGSENRKASGTKDDFSRGSENRKASGTKDDFSSGSENRKALGTKDSFRGGEAEGGFDDSKVRSKGRSTFGGESEFGGEAGFGEDSDSRFGSKLNSKQSSDRVFGKGTSYPTSNKSYNKFDTSSGKGKGAKRVTTIEEEDVAGDDVDYTKDIAKAEKNITAALKLKSFAKTVEKLLKNLSGLEEIASSEGLECEDDADAVSEWIVSYDEGEKFSKQDKKDFKKDVKAYTSCVKEGYADLTSDDDETI